MEKTFQVCRVRWTDAAHISGWHNREALEEVIRDGMEIMESVGWLIHRDERFVLLGMTRHNLKMAELMQIPMNMVLEIWGVAGEDSPHPPAPSPKGEGEE